MGWVQQNNTNRNGASTRHEGNKHIRIFAKTRRDTLPLIFAEIARDTLTPIIVGPLLGVEVGGNNMMNAKLRVRLA